jgi:hypothetical protein
MEWTVTVGDVSTRIRVSGSGVLALVSSYLLVAIWWDFQSEGHVYQIIETLVGYRRICPPEGSGRAEDGSTFSWTSALLAPPVFWIGRWFR